MDQKMDNPGDYYAAKAAAAEAWLKLRDWAIVKAMPSSVIRKLEKHLEQAREVGD
jgi:hypothetical protein